MKFAVGQWVYVNRRIDPNDFGPKPVREWKPAVVRRYRDSRTKGDLYEVSWFDGYYGPTSYFEDKISAHNPAAIIMHSGPVTMVDVGSLKPEAPKKQLHDNCPKCGSAGSWVRMALVCPFHGVWAGC
jgi:hypothetical protein